MPTPGEQLKQAREARKLSIQQAVQATRLRSYYIEALEADDWPALPSVAQARGFLRLYADYLGLDSAEMVEQQRRSGETAHPPSPDSTPTTQEPAPPPVIIEKPKRPEPPPEQPVALAEEEAKTPSLPPGPPPLSQAILQSIGNSLHERRELLSLTLDEIERHTHVRRHFLEQVENGDFDSLPSLVQARGMLSAYASFLDMDAEAVLLRYADALQARRIEHQPPAAPKTAMPRLRIKIWPWLKRFISPDLIFGGSMIIILLGLSIWGATRLLPANLPSEEPTGTEGPSISEVLLATPIGGLTPTVEVIPTSVSELGTAIPTLDPAFIVPTETATLNFTPASAVQITIIVVERTFLRVTVDGNIVFDERAAPGAALPFDGNERIEVLTGSGGAIQVIYNQQNLGVAGNMGEVVDRIYTVNGVQTPTPTPSPLPTNTPRQTPTAAPSFTASPTNTRLP